MSTFSPRSLAALACAGLLLGSLACKPKAKGETLGLGGSLLADDKSAVCMIEGLGVRATPGKAGKVVASLSLGESVKLTGDPDQSEGGKTYRKVELSDGKSGWAPDTGIVAPAKVATLLDDAPLFKRPDAMTATAQKVPFMAIVAITDQKGEWIQVLGEGRRIQGWLRTSAVSLAKEEVTAASLATKKLRAKEDLGQEQKVAAILGSTPFPNAVVMQRLRERGATLPAQTPAPAPSGDAAPANGNGSGSEIKWSDDSAQTSH